MRIDNIIKLTLVVVPVLFVVLGVFTTDSNKSTMLISGGLGSFGTLLKVTDNKEFVNNKLEVNEGEKID